MSYNNQPLNEKAEPDAVDDGGIAGAGHQDVAEPRGVKDRLAAEQDFKVNLKSELLLEELMRRTKAREAQLQEIADGIKSLKR